MLTLCTKYVIHYLNHLSTANYLSYFSSTSEMKLSFRNSPSQQVMMGMMYERAPRRGDDGDVVQS